MFEGCTKNDTKIMITAVQLLSCGRNLCIYIDDVIKG
jgi:hypothetical protein